MKKNFIFILTVLLVLSFAGCGAGEGFSKSADVEMDASKKDPELYNVMLNGGLRSASTWEKYGCTDDIKTDVIVYDDGGHAFRNTYYIGDDVLTYTKTPYYSTEEWYEHEKGGVWELNGEPIVADKAKEMLGYVEK